MKLTPDEFAALVEEALQDIPEPFATYMRDVTVHVEAIPDRETCEAVGIKDPRTLLGLYRGVPLTGRSVEYVTRLPDRIIIYQNNIEGFARTRAQVVRQIRKTVFHEVGHHFGLSEEDLAKLGYR